MQEEQDKNQRIGIAPFENPDDYTVNESEEETWIISSDKEIPGIGTYKVSVLKMKPEALKDEGSQGFTLDNQGNIVKDSQRNFTNKGLGMLIVEASNLTRSAQKNVTCSVWLDSFPDVFSGTLLESGESDDKGHLETAGTEAWDVHGESLGFFVDPNPEALAHIRVRFDSTFSPSPLPKSGE